MARLGERSEEAACPPCPRSHPPSPPVRSRSSTSPRRCRRRRRSSSCRSRSGRPGRSQLEEISRYDERGPGLVLEQHPHRRAHRHPLRRADPLGHRPGRRRRRRRCRPRRLVAPAACSTSPPRRPTTPTSCSRSTHIEAWEAEHGPLPDGGWLLYRTGWDARSDDQAGVPQRRRDRPAHAGHLRRVRAVAGRGGAGHRRRRGDGRHRRRRRALVRPAVPVPLVPARRRQVRPDPAAEPRRLPPTGAVRDRRRRCRSSAAPAARPGCSRSSSAERAGRDRSPRPSAGRSRGLGVDHVFGVVGSGNFHVTNALVAAGARFVAARARGRRGDDGRRVRPGQRPASACSPCTRAAG